MFVFVLIFLVAAGVVAILCVVDVFLRHKNALLDTVLGWCLIVLIIWLFAMMIYAISQ